MGGVCGDRRQSTIERKSSLDGVGLSRSFFRRRSVQAAAEKHDAAGDPPDLVEIGFVAFLVALFSAGLAPGGNQTSRCISLARS